MDITDEDRRMLKAIRGGLGIYQKSGLTRFGGEDVYLIIEWLEKRLV